MGRWGMDIEANDTYADVEEEFLQCIEDEMQKSELYEHFFTDDDFEDEISEETYDWWYAIADLLWQHGYLENKILSVVKQLIESKVEIELWQEMQVEETDLRAREVILKDFLNKISTRNRLPNL